MLKKNLLLIPVSVFLANVLVLSSSLIGSDEIQTFRLNPGEKLIAGEQLQVDLRFVLMQADGNFVMSTEGGRQAHWSTNTQGNAGAEILLQLDGNLVLSLPGGPSLWSSETEGNPSAWLVLQPDGNLAVNGPVAIWSSNTAGNYGAELVMQNDGNLVIYDISGKAIWNTETEGYPGAHYVMQPDGNLVINDVNGVTRWSSGTYSNAGARLQMQSDGNLVILADRALWSSNTGPIPWMERERGRILDTPLRELAIPGSHESATHDLSKVAWGDDGNLSFITFEALLTVRPGYVHGWATAQSRSIGNQLVDGIRYIDLRLINNGGNYRAIHTVMGTSLNTITQQIKDYTDKNPLEIVIIDFQALFGINAGDLWAAIQNDLGDKLVPYPQNLNSLTVGDIWDMGKQIIAISKLPAPPMLWPRGDVLKSKWPNKQSVGSLHDYIANNVTSSPDNNGKFWVVQGVVTPKPNFGNVLSNNWKGYKNLEEVADDVTPEVVSWMEGWQGDALWSTGTEGNPGATYEMQLDGNLVVSDINGGFLWNSETEGNPGARLLMQDDGNLVIIARRSIWSSQTDGYFGAELIMQDDGNLVVLSQNRKALWSTETEGNPGAWYAMQDDGNFVVYSANGVALWDSNTERNYGARLLMQDDGNLVVYSASGRALWASNTAGYPGAILVMQADGNLVIYSSRIPVWNSETEGNPGAWYAMQDDGNLVVYSAGGQLLWASNTDGNPGAQLAMQADGNLSITVDKTIWDAGTFGNPGARYIMQADGNFVVYGGKNQMNIVIADFYHKSNFVGTAIRANRNYLGPITGIDDDPRPTIPSSFTLSQNYPNPFNPSTVISFDLPRRSEWQVTIFNMMGQVVRRFDGESAAGIVTLEWDASDYATGIYLYRLNAGEFSQTRKMLLLK